MPPKHKNLTWVTMLVLGLLVVVCVAVVFGVGSGEGSVPTIPNMVPEKLLNQEEIYLSFLQDFEAQPIPHVPLPQHPHMASNAGNNMHNDAYMSDTYEAPGPISKDAVIRSRTQGFGGYGTIAFDRYNRLVAVYSNARAFQLELMDAYTLVELAAYDLPPRPLDFLFSGVMPWEYIGAGMYFYLDERDRAVIPTTNNAIQIVQVPAPDEAQGFQLVKEYDLSAYVKPITWPQRDSLAWVLPDWNGGYYWFATTEGIVGTLAWESGSVETYPLQGEIIENSFAVGEEGVFIISDYAMYRFHQENGKIFVDWRTPYERGSAKKPGHITRGSGTSVSLMGDMNGLVAVTDNADERIHLLAIRRSDGEVVCQVPLFSAGKSGTDISLIAFEGADERGAGTGVYSVIAENNWGHHVFPIARLEAGLERVDIVRHPDGAYTCQKVWESEEKNQGVMKLSFANGIIYTYFKDESPLINKWYFTGVDFYSGKTVFKHLSGTGIGFNNWAGALFLHPGGGVAYSTTIFGLVMLDDRLESPPELVGRRTP